MTTLLHLSDPHFGTERAHVVEALVTWVNTVARADVVMLSGDLTQRATAAQFAQVKAFIGRLDVPRVLTIPGNHDIPLFDVWARLHHPLRRYTHALGADSQPVFESPELLLIALDTTRRWRHKHGELSAQQIEATSARLRRARAGQLRVVVTHQPCAVPSEDERVNLVRGGEAALQAWSRAGADLVLGGHIHWPVVLAGSGVGRILMGNTHRSELAVTASGREPDGVVVGNPADPRHAETGQAPWVVLAGTAVSRRIRREDGNSCNLIRWHASVGRCEVERWDYVDAASPLTGTTLPASSPLPSSSDGWRKVSSVALACHRPPGP